VSRRRRNPRSQRMVRSREERRRSGLQSRASPPLRSLDLEVGPIYIFCSRVWACCVHLLLVPGCYSCVHTVRLCKVFGPLS
jgi:hypothetical protein